MGLYINHKMGLVLSTHLTLVGGLEHEWIMTFHSVGNGIIPTDELTHHQAEG